MFFSLVHFKVWFDLTKVFFFRLIKKRDVKFRFDDSSGWDSCSFDFRFDLLLVFLKKLIRK